MKNFIWVGCLLFLAISSTAQTQYGFATTPICWDSAGVQKPVNKVTYYSTTSTTEKKVGYFHAVLGYKITSSITSANTVVTGSFCDTIASGGGTQPNIAAVVVMCDVEGGYVTFLRVIDNLYGYQDYNEVMGSYLPVSDNMVGACPVVQEVSLYCDRAALSPLTTAFGSIVVPSAWRECVIYNSASRDVEISMNDISGIGSYNVIVAAWSTLSISTTTLPEPVQTKMAPAFDFVYFDALDDTPYQALSITVKSY
jgi:hypothetical protein